MSLPRVETTPIPGLLVVHLDLRTDARGFFKENWQREKMIAAGLPDFAPVQNNVSFNTDRGVTRGIHTEPWDKLISLATGRIFGAWVDMREGDSFGATFSLELDTSTAVFVPRGVGNSYQTLEDGTAYTYLVNQHWRAGITYPALALDDASAAIAWPIPLDECEISEKDQNNPGLDPASAIPRQRMLVLGGNGQVGRALAAEFPEALVVGRDVLDLTDPAAVAAWDWWAHDVVINAAAYTAVDAAETPQGRRDAWAANATAPATLAALSREHGFTLVHFSSDYVFDGENAPEGGWTEASPMAPTSVYGQSKAAGDLAVTGAPHHYILRCSWVVGDGNNFVRTMRSLAERGISPSVVDDQVGRPTFAPDIARAVRELLTQRPPHGTFHISNSGDTISWHTLAMEVFTLSGREANDVAPISSLAYAEGRAGVAPRPSNSALDTTKLSESGITLPHWRDSLSFQLTPTQKVR